MYCGDCGKHNLKDSKFCKHCGASFNDFSKDSESDNTNLDDQKTTSISTKKPFNVKIIITILIVLGIIGSVIYGNLDKQAIDTNNGGVTSLDSGNSKTGIEQFKQAASEAKTNDTKISTLKNLGYAYATDNQNNLALNAFKEALVLTTTDTFDYYLISAEVAILEGKPNDAQFNYDKAYQLDPEDFQVNNGLNLFYLDLGDIAPEYKDYKKALPYAQKAYEVSKLEIAKHNLAIAYYFNENYDQVISLLSPSDLSKFPYGSYILGLSYMVKKDDINAKINLRKASDGGIELPQEVKNYLNSN
jgi:tetratricopeptide (TPR) repeat protein